MALPLGSICVGDRVESKNVVFETRSRVGDGVVWESVF